MMVYYLKLCFYCNLRNFIFVCLFYSLLKAAEEYHLPKALKCSKGGGLKEFSLQDFQYFEGSNNEQTFFTTEERQWLVLRILESIRAKPSDANALPGANLLEGQPIGGGFCCFFESDNSFVVLVPKCLTSGIISQVFPLHDPPELEKLQNNWVRDIWSSQPLGTQNCLLFERNVYRVTFFR